VLLKFSLMTSMNSSFLNKETCLAVTAVVHMIPINMLLKRGHLCLQKEFLQESLFFHHLVSWKRKKEAISTLRDIFTTPIGSVLNC